MDWEGIRTAIADRERARLGLPSREQEAAARAKREQEAALAASQLETAGLTREKTRAEIAALPAEQDLQRRVQESVITRNEREPQPHGASSNLQWLMSLSPADRDAAIAAQQRLNPRSEPVDRAAWQPQYDAGGNLLGFVHLGRFYDKTAMGVPSDARRPLSAGEKSELALLDNPARLPEIFRDALQRVRETEADNPVASGTGPFMGRVGNVYREHVSTAGPGGDFDAARKQVRQIVYGLSGKQLNQSELQWLDSITPNLNDPGVDEQINRFDAFVTALTQAKRQGISDPFTAARLGFGIQRQPGAAAAQSVKVQQNRRTGEVRHSLDGGATWQPGPPPQ